MSCDIRFAAADAKLTTSFARLGLVAEHGVAWLLPRLVGDAHARDLLLSGRTVTGAEAAAMGLVNRAVTGPDTLAEALANARLLVESGCPASWAAIKRRSPAAGELTLRAAYEQAADLMEPALSRLTIAKACWPSASAARPGSRRCLRPVGNISVARVHDRIDRDHLSAPSWGTVLNLVAIYSKMDKNEC